MLKVIIFDFDGTLADTVHIMFKAYEKLLAKFNLPLVTFTELEEIRTLSIKERFKKAGVPMIKMPALLRETRQIYAEHISSANPFPGIEEVLRALKAKGYRLSIISSNTEKNIRDFLASHDLELFEQIHCTSSLFGKHRTIKKSLAKLGISSAEAVYIGDELRDIMACKKVPIRVIAVSWGYDSLCLLQQGHPDHIAHEINDLLPLVDQL